MKGYISLGSFIHQVREELEAAVRPGEDPFYELRGVELEVTFGIESTGGGKGRLLVVDLEGKVATSQTHRVKLQLKPIPTKLLLPSQDLQPTAAPPNLSGGGGGGGGGLFKQHHVQYAEPEPLWHL